MPHPIFTAFVLALLTGACLESRDGSGSGADASSSALPSDVEGDINAPDATVPDETVGEPETSPPDVVSGDAMIEIKPASISFGMVEVGKSALTTLNISNRGSASLFIAGFALSGHPGFELIIDDVTYAVSPDTASGVHLDPPLVIEPGKTKAIEVRYTANAQGPAVGQAVFYSNDPKAPVGTLVPLEANVGTACVLIEPQQVTFGPVRLGRSAQREVRIASCGDEPLEIKEVLLGSDSSSEFSLSLRGDAVPDGSSGGLGHDQAPIVLQQNEAIVALITYFPEDESPRDAAGQPLLDRAALRVAASVAERKIEITGWGSLDSCPTAIISVAEGEEVIPQTLLHLVGSQSFSPNGPIAAYRWTADTPEGALPLFLPSADVPDPRFEVNVVGVYRFRLSVVDEIGFESCTAAEYTVYAVPDEAIHIELLWTTPNDPDETDEQVGADLDLHFTHPLAVGGYDGDGDGQMDGWFDLPFDCFWHNEQPNWGAIDYNVDDNPGLDRDDTDGVGPENLNFNLPEEVTYRVGVHYWDDHSFGPSYATVRIYIFGNLVFEVSDVFLLKHDMWWVTNLTWPPSAGTVPQLIRVCSGTFESCESDSDCGSGNICGPRITPSYHHPEFFQP